VLCGPGNNGGDGFVVARLLKEWGWEVEVFLYGDAGKLPPDAKVNYERWGEMGEVLPIRNLERLPTSFEQPRLVIDGLFGTGLKREISEQLGTIANELMRFRRVSCSVCAIDMPSGICSDSGNSLSSDVSKIPFLYADLTVTFHRPKIGLYSGFGPTVCKKVVCKDIGINHREWVKALGWSAESAEGRKNFGRSVVRLAERESLTPEFMGSQSILDKEYVGHKYSHGHAFILSGGVGRGGAARMAARGALRIGAGLVTVGCPPAALIENAAQLDAVMLRAVKGADKLTEVLEDARINALCVGPGLGTGARVAEVLRVVLTGGGMEPRPTVLDADALSLVAADAQLFETLHERCVLTPHGGEFARLFPDIAEKLNATPTHGPAYSKVDATRAAAARAECVVLFKGPDTVIAHPDGRCSINSAQYDREAPWLATAGSGDVLAGFITGLLARGFKPMQAAETAAWLHVECARSFGPGLIAEDLPEELPKVFRQLGL
jgi:hydroxyethylthiazole kinase-like uncharacterized protein yjeF